MSESVNWFREEHERARALNAQVPPHARMVVTNPALSARPAPVVARPAPQTEGERDHDE